jgi:2-C-methyl-D-erythritol 2,4-cyclodiphosphate synthase
MRVGIGYDVHPLVPGRRLVLGGVEIQFDKGLSGYSDADVLTHAIMDALLGAAGLRDIGTQFPAEDPKYKDISSLVLLDEVGELLKAKSFKIVNIDAVVVAEQPKIAPFIENMRRSISRTLGIKTKQIMIKATSTDGLGFAGRVEGIAAYAVALVEEETK